MAEENGHSLISEDLNTSMPDAGFQVETEFCFYCTESESQSCFT